MLRHEIVGRHHRLADRTVTLARSKTVLVFCPRMLYLSGQRTDKKNDVRRLHGHKEVVAEIFHRQRNIHGRFQRHVFKHKKEGRTSARIHPRIVPRDGCGMQCRRVAYRHHIVSTLQSPKRPLQQQTVTVLRDPVAALPSPHVRQIDVDTLGQQLHLGTGQHTQQYFPRVIKYDARNGLGLAK